MLYCAGLGVVLADDMGLGKTVQTITPYPDKIVDKMGKIC